MTQKQGRRHGLSSRLRPLDGPRTPWTSPDGAVVDLPVVFDLVMTDPETEIEAWRVEATVGMRSGDPALLQMVVTCGPGGGGLDPAFLQREFRWATPLEAVTRLVPLIVQAGKDPYAMEFPAQGYPEVTRSPQVSVTNSWRTSPASTWCSAAAIPRPWPRSIRLLPARS